MLEHRATTVRRRALALVASLASATVVGVLLPATAGATTPPPRRIVSGWGYFTSTTSGGMPSLAANADLFTDVSPFWYSAQWTGSTSTIAAPYAGNKATVLPAIRATGVKVLPTITDGMPARRMAAVMAGSSSRATLVSQIVSLVTSNGFDGIDLDFENFAFVDGSSTWSTTRPAWDAFIAALAAGLHAKGKMLSVTVPAGTATSSDSTGYWVYDWSAMGRYADRVRIMAYDYSPSNPGPIAPFWWVDRVAAHAVTQIPSGKVQIGVPAYGRDWYLSTSGTCPTLPPAGSTSAQSSTFFSDISWAGQRHTFNSSGGSGYVSGLFKADAASLPSGSIVTSPSTVSSSFDSTGGEQTFPYSVTFNGQSQPATVSTTAVGGLPGTSSVIVGSTAGIQQNMAVSGTGVGSNAVVQSVDAGSGTVTLSVANTGLVTGLLTFGTVASTTMTGTPVAPATPQPPQTVAVASAAGIVVGMAVSSSVPNVVAPGTTVTAVDVPNLTVTLSAPLVGQAPAGTPVTFTNQVSSSAVGGVQGGSTLLLASAQGVTKGGAVTGTGVAQGATVTGVNGNTVTLSAANSGTVTGAVSVRPAPTSASCTVSRVGWYSDAQAVAQTATLVGKYQLLGIAEWTIGGEDAGQWSRLRSYAQTIAPTPTAVTLAAPAVATYGTRTSVRVTALSAGVPAPGVAVTLFFRAPGARGWTRVAQTLTSSTGAAYFTPLVTSAGTFHAYVSGDYYRAPGVGERTVGLRTLVRVAAPTARVASGSKVVVTARLLPRHKGQVAVLQVLRSGKYVTLGVRKTDVWGRAVFVVAPTGKHARVIYRLIAGSAPGVYGTRSWFSLYTK